MSAIPIPTPDANANDTDHAASRTAFSKSQRKGACSWFSYRKLWIVAACGVCLLTSFSNTLLVETYSLSQSHNDVTAIPLTKAVANTSARPFTIVVLTMKRLSSLQRLIKSLQEADYGTDTVNLVIQVGQPFSADDNQTKKQKKNKKKHSVNQQWTETVNWVLNSVEWPFGSVKFHVAEEQHEGLKHHAWLEAWQPQSMEDRAIILQNDNAIQVSPLWYKWVQAMHEHYGNRPDVAGFSLQRLVADNNHEPFLYSLVGSIGFSPIARVWRDFTEWAKCSLCMDLDLGTSERETDQQMMWTRHMNYFMKYYNLFCLYQLPFENKALAVAGTTTLGADFQLAQSSGDLDFTFPTKVARFDSGFSALAPAAAKIRTVVIAAAVGGYHIQLSKSEPVGGYHYELSTFERFVGTLRKFYNGDVKILISDKTSDDIRIFLRKHHIDFYETSEGKNWQEFNKFRFSFYRSACTSGNYDWCLALDSRDVIFQANPFHPSLEAEKSDLLLFGHHQIHTPGHWHFKLLEQCGRQHFVEKLMKKREINAGGILGKPSAFITIGDLMLDEILHGCNDQVVLNVGVYAGLMNNTISHKIFNQGYGTINNVAFGGRFAKDTLGRFGGQDCFVSPVVHQYDRDSLKPPLNAKCLTNVSITAT
jgi:hypothetical protein